MRNLLRGLCVLGGATVLFTAFFLVVVFRELSSDHLGMAAAFAALFGGMLVAVIGIVLAQLLVFRSLLRMEQERERREGALSRKFKTELERVVKSNEQLIGGLQVISERITQTRQSVDDLKS